MYERALFVHICWRLRLIFGGQVEFLSDFACSGGSWMGFYFDECAVCAWGVCWVGAMLWCEYGVWYL